MEVGDQSIYYLKVEAGGNEKIAFPFSGFYCPIFHGLVFQNPDTGGSHGYNPLPAVFLFLNPFSRLGRNLKGLGVDLMLRNPFRFYGSECSITDMQGNRSKKNPFFLKGRYKLQ